MMRSFNSSRQSTGCVFAFFIFILLRLYSSCLALSTLSSTAYDVIVIGGGAAGLTAAKLAGDTLQKSVVIIEAERMGGDCTWTGCVPSKSLLAAAKSIHSARKYGLLGPNEKANFSAIRRQIAENMQRIYDADDSPKVLENMGVDVLAGRARLKSSSIVAVEMKDRESFTVTAKEGIILATGASPFVPSNIAGLDTVKFLTSETVWSLKEIPDRFTVLGGGPVGCEIAQAFSRLGAQVTIVAPGLLPRDDPEVGHVLESVFTSEGIKIVKGWGVSVFSGATGRHSLTIRTLDGSNKVIDGDQLMVALGRSPRTQGMGLQEAGIELTETGGIKVDEKLRTSVKGVYAAGDCTGDRQYTHYAGFQGAIAARNILLPLSDRGVLNDIPSAVYSMPEVASVGLSEQLAFDTHGKESVQIAHKSLSEVDRAICEGETDGFIKVVFLKKNGKILGATIVSPSAAEMISEISVAMEAGFPFYKLAKVMHAYPAYSIALQLMAADVYYKKTLRFKPIYDILKKVGL